jgi:PIN domain nuclease of toxin-antitoxin system
MKILLDTHIWLWYLLEDPKLSKNLQVIIADSSNEIWLSPVSIWEALLVGEKGKLILDPDPVSWVKSALKTLETHEAPLNNEIAILSRQLDCPHQDPADRFIAATAIYYDLYLATVDKNLIDTPLLNTIS